MTHKPDLYSPNLEDRFRASVEATALGDLGKWPRACWGAANAWLVLVGPSHGRVDPGAEEWPGGPDRPFDVGPVIGEDACPISFQSNKGRNKRWAWLTQAVLGTAEKAAALTAVANLDWGHHANQWDIPEDYLQRGCPVVFRLIEQTKPRVVVTLGQRTWNVFSKFLKSREARSQPQLTELSHLIIQLDSFSAETLFLKSPQHPSRHFFTERHAAAIRDAVSKFVGGDHQ